MNRSSLFLRGVGDQSIAEILVASHYVWDCNFKSDIGYEIIFIFFFSTVMPCNEESSYQR